MRRWFGASVGAVSGAVLCLLACSSGGASVSTGEARCRRLCEEAKKCPSSNRARPVNCFTSCDDLEALNRANDCYDEVDAYYDCIERNGVCADLATTCAERQDVYSDCLADPCSTDPDRDVCL